MTALEWYIRLPHAERVEVRTDVDAYRWMGVPEHEALELVMEERRKCS